MAKPDCAIEIATVWKQPGGEERKCSVRVGWTAIMIVALAALFMFGVVQMSDVTVLLRSVPNWFVEAIRSG